MIELNIVGTTLAVILRFVAEQVQFIRQLLAAENRVEESSESEPKQERCGP